MTRLTEDLRRVKRYLTYLGSRAGLAALAQEARATAARELTVKHPSLRKPVVLRTHSSDIDTFGKVITEREYDLPELANVKSIIDAGANIGLASRFFAEKFPEARIIALEPESSNFDLLVRNLQDYPNVTCLKKALWSTSGTLTIFDPGDGKWGFRTGGAETSDVAGSRMDSVDCVSIPDLMTEYGLSRIDLLKIDIEGSEKEVFDNADGWITKVDVIVAELHDRFKRGCSKAFYNATAEFSREVHKGENIFVFR